MLGGPRKNANNSSRLCSSYVLDTLQRSVCSLCVSEQCKGIKSWCIVLAALGIELSSLCGPLLCLLPGFECPKRIGLPATGFLSLGLEEFGAALFVIARLPHRHEADLVRRKSLPTLLRE